METSTAATDSAVDVDLGFDEESVVKDTRVEQWLNEWRLPFELDQQFPIARVKVETAVQIREEAHRAPSSTVDQYFTHMKHGAIFPPVVVSSNGLLVDGNTRLEAARRNGLKTFPAYKVKFPHLGMAKMIGAALNQMGGDRLTDEEIVTAAEAMMAEQYGDEAIARTLGRSVSHVRNVRRDRMFRQSAERTGVANLTVPKAAQRILAGIQHDEPFKAAVEVVSRAKPSAKDISTLVNKIEQTRSDADALATIRTIESQWGPLAGPPPNQKSVSRTKAKAALKHVRALLELAEAQPIEVVQADDQEAAEVWRRLSTVSAQVVALYVKP